MEIDARPSALQQALGPQLLTAIREAAGASSAASTTGGEEDEGAGAGAVEVVGVGVGMKASTPYGDGRVVGVARGDIWCVGRGLDWVYSLFF